MASCTPICATAQGVDKVIAAIGDRPVAALFANAGHGLGKGFLDQDFREVAHVINTNITGTIRACRYDGH